jgi:acetolactate synthase-1/2/3 large subunit
MWRRRDVTVPVSPEPWTGMRLTKRRVLRSASPCAMLLGGKALSRADLRAVARIRAATGCDLFCDTFPSRVERGAGLPPVARIPYFPDHAAAALSRYQAVVLAGAREPVTFFGYEGCSSFILGGHQRKVAIGDGGRDEQAALELLATPGRHPGVARAAGAASTKSSPGSNARICPKALSPPKRPAPYLPRCNRRKPSSWTRH